MGKTRALAAWLAGFGQADITPPSGHGMSGFVARQEPSLGAHDPLFARCLVLSDHTTQAAIIVLDVIGVDAHLTAAIRAAAASLTGIEPEAIVVLATHTHGGPATLRDALLGRPNPGYLAELICKAATAAAHAVANQQPAILRYGEGRNVTVARNRREAGGIIDPDVPVLRFERPDGRLLGLLTSYACHPVTLGPNNRCWTADYPGELLRALELLEPHASALFATGCCGQINVGHHSSDSVAGRGLERRSFSESRRLGRALAGTVLAASESVASPGGKPLLELVPSLRVQRQSLELALSAPASHVELRHHVRAWRAELKALASDEGAVGTAHYIQGQLKWAEKVAARPLRVVPAEIMVVTLGDLRIAIFPGEVFVEYGIELKRHVSPQQIMTLAFGNAAPGYIPYGTAFMQGGYEVEDAYRFYGFPAPIAPEAGELLLSAMIDLVREAP